MLKQNLVFVDKILTGGSLLVLRSLPDNEAQKAPNTTVNGKGRLAYDCPERSAHAVPVAATCAAKEAAS